MSRAGGHSPGAPVFTRDISGLARQAWPMSLFTLFKSLFTTRLTVTPPQALPDGKLRIHLLHGTFPNEQTARDYCYAAQGDLPEQITREQPDAFIDTGFVEVVYQAVSQRLLEFLPAQEAEQIVADMTGSNTLVIITEDAFAGLPYALVSNQTLSYLGPWVVDA